ncbi:125_t:CDS:2 [Ambispora leptoticha]|uniref:125_t:CDS:1 n=1 Tax=Ambispora leptoticha TaxID=144679 RepID=A0A9N8VKC1_9GLOM|nr:125_t:CDS:2 [Ambispora leptoticha]
MDVLNLPDILTEIFENLVESSKFSSIISDKSDNKDLFNCLLVNRLWCRTTVPLLWRQPFQPTREHGYKAIGIYFQCMDKKDRKTIQKRGFQLPPIKIAPVFNYPSFLIGLNYRWFLNAVEDWCYKTPVKPHTGLLKCCKSAKVGQVAETDDIVFVARKLLKLLVDNNVVLKRLCISSIPRAVEAVDRKKYLIWAESEFVILFSSVKELVVSGQFFDQANDLTSLSNLCRLVSRLVIYTWVERNVEHESSTREVGNALTTLIKNQNGLKEFCIRDAGGLSKFIISALPSQKDSLSYVRFHKVDFRNSGAWNGLTECSKLRKLSFFQCEQVTKDNVQPLFRATFPHLKELEAKPDIHNGEHLMRWIRTMN